MTHLLVTNDFPPKVGGIQSLLWELWRRLPADSFAVLTTPDEGAGVFDLGEPYRIERRREPVLLPTPSLARHIDCLADEIGASIVLLDPALPVGLLGPHLRRPYGVLVHGAEVTVPGRLPGVSLLLRHVLRGAREVIAFGGYPAAEAERAAGRTLPITNIPPGVDVGRFTPLDSEARIAARRRLGLSADGMLVVSVSRLVPRKGMDVLIDAAARLAPDHPDLHVLIGGTGRDHDRLQRRIDATGAPVALLGFVPDDDLPDLYAAADVYAMLCRNRWAGLEQEGFGIVFLEAAAAGTPQIAGDSGGAAEAVIDGETGLVVRHPSNPAEVAGALARLLGDDELRGRLATSGRRRAENEFAYDVLADRLAATLQRWEEPR